jgi:hypothetical protein
MATLEKQFRGLNSDVLHIKEGMQANTEALREYIELSKHFTFTLKFLGWIESIAVWVAKVAAALGIMWGVWRYIISEALRQLGEK